MGHDSQLKCDPFRIDIGSQRLWNGSEEIELTPKAWAVLRCLIERPGQLLTKTELLDTVWGTVNVGEGSLSKAIFELRSAFGDTQEPRRFLATVHGRGFRFIAPLTPADSLNASAPIHGDALASTAIGITAELPFIGRIAELRQLSDRLASALQGQRQIVFVTGEPGIGKTSLIDEFLRSPRHATPLLIGHGQCIEQYGPREAFMPLFEAVGRLCRQAGGERLIELLRRHAPTWLCEMPGLLSTADREVLQRQTLPVTPERMLRMMVEALEVISTQTPVILVLEDLHWSDYSTIDLLSAVAQRRESARLLVLATYRPVDAILQRHPVHEVRQSLQLHGRCHLLALELLSPAGAHEYVQRRFAPNDFPEGLIALLQAHTGGNPLFLMAELDYLCAEGWLAQRDGIWQLEAPLDSISLGVPETLRQLIERQHDKLQPQERLALEIASVAGHTFTSRLVAAAASEETSAFETILNGLARRAIFVTQLAAVTWPDGTSATQYRFIHSLYQRTLYDRIPAEQRKRWHQRIAETIEAGYRGRTAEVAAELAVHFDRAGVHEKCIEHFTQAASNASRRFADQEAIAYLQRALQELSFLPGSTERTYREIGLLMNLGALQLTTLGYGSSVARDTYARILSLCREHPMLPMILPALGGLALYHLNKGELEQAQHFGEQMLATAERLPLPPEMLAYSRAPLLLALYYRGRLTQAVECLESGVALCDPTEYSQAPHVWSDHGVSMLGYMAIALVLRGQPDQAIARSRQALERAAKLGLAGSVAHSYCFAAVMRYFLRDWTNVEELGAEAVKLTEENGLRFWKAQALTIHGAGLAQVGRVEEGIASLRAGYAEMRAAGGIATGTYVHCMTAEAFLKSRRFDEAERELSEGFALVEQTDERFAEPELYRNRAVIALLRSASVTDRHATEAETSFEAAIETARGQGARWWELRATVGLCGLWRDQGRRREAADRLEPVYAGFNEGAATADLKEAAELLADLRRSTRTKS